MKLVTLRETPYKAIPLHRLRELLSSLPDDTLVGVNQVQNFLLLDAHEIPIAYVDVMEETLKWFTEDR